MTNLLSFDCVDALSYTLLPQCFAVSKKIYTFINDYRDIRVQSVGDLQYVVIRRGVHRVVMLRTLRSADGLGS